ncbi:hypothetical protein O181_080713 [Austropuccinia psidii MF-1]|uniref:Reverse transcriptase Ty1/copia-type domain-containing protein n=1 Tax=Austropuccinia psidii MF-1 TaxID=1389203 RepID=A0A9Q3IGS4_9BASI|nr:hypothetical protein [Austropuccinia psidii MF-1]
MQDKRVVISRHVKFDETYFPSLLPSLSSTKTLNPILPIPTNTLYSPTKPVGEVTDENDSCSECEEEFHGAMEEKPQRRIKIIGPRHPTLIRGDVSEENILPYQRRAHQTVESSLIPNNYQQAIKSKDSDKWEEAISRELDNMEKLKVWTIRDRTPEDHPITCTWVFKIKSDDEKRVIEHKASTRSRGWITCRLSLPLAESFHQMDVKSAFLNAPLNENICLAAPEGVNIPATKVLHLNKAIYGLKQAPLSWYNHLATWLVSVEEIQQKFDMKDLGKANLLLGIKILHSKAGFSLLQEHYIKNIAVNFGITQLAPTNTPLKPGLQLMKASEEEIESFQKLGFNYRSIIGALNYISTNTRPDITFAISHLSQFLERPSLKHWLASLQVLCYLYHTKEKTLNYYNKGKCKIISYADADWGNSLIDRRSVGGYTLFLNHHLISWRMKKQQTISHSTTEAEYKSLSDASKEVLWFQQLLQEIKIEVPGNIPTLYNNNKCAINLAHSNINHNGFKTKHMDIKFHFIWDLIKNQKLELFYVSTHLMAADFLTKAVWKTILLRSKSFINLY